MLKIEYVKTADLIPYANNPRKNDAAVDKVVESIREFGFKNPIIVDGNNEIIAGHTRLKAAEKLGIDEVPTIKAEDLTPEQVKAFRIADNKTHEFAEWDMSLLKEELKEIEIDLFTGFEQDELFKKGEIINIEELLNEADPSAAIDKPIWVTIRADSERMDLIEKAMSQIAVAGVRIERSYEMG